MIVLKSIDARFGVMGLLCTDGSRCRVTRGSYKRGMLNAYTAFRGAGFRAVLEPIMEADDHKISIPEALKALELMAVNLPH